ncbi:MAG TPA: isoprenylcysteine carboxylmethyltransferase family protein [Vicinamibacterales bacterium]|nr:isoprenylcysteine carboxylmethyltransferase family protein [Vicinamibacterales bacterium]
MTHNLVYTWPYALFFWAAFAWTFGPESRVISSKREPPSTPHDASSKRLIVFGQGLAMMSAFVVAGRIPSAALPHPVRFLAAGIALMLAGSLLRRHCFRMLGSSFTGAVVVSPEQTVVERGAYRYVRHPSYTAGAIIFLGVGLALANWISIAVLMTIVPIVYGYRVVVEERALADVIGEPYRQYMCRTKRFVPLVF